MEFFEIKFDENFLSASGRYVEQPDGSFKFEKCEDAPTTGRTLQKRLQLRH